MAEHEAEAADVDRDRPRWPPTLATAVGSLFVLWGVLIGSARLSDNSFLTHLATGRLIVESGIPRTDPYSFTAGGTDWVVQSWLVSALYGLLEDLWGAGAIRIAVMAAMGVLGALVWMLTRPAESLLPRLGIASLVMAIGTLVWSERPLLVGLVCFALYLLAAEGRIGGAWLVPIGWIWANSHGSFPLGLVVLGCLAVGRRLDGDRPEVEVRALGWAVLGTVLAAVNPLGPALLVFPVELLGRGEVLAHVLEWQSPSFADPWARLFLVQVVVAVVGLVRRPRYRTALTLVVFTAAALVATRNIGVASLALVPGLAASLSGLGTLVGDRRSPATAVGTVAVVLLGPVLAWSATSGEQFDLERYPVREVSMLEDQGLLPGEARLATTDFAGNYLEFRYGDDAEVFVDDRYDMYPPEVSEDYVTLLAGEPGWAEILDARSIDLVLWPSDEPLAELLEVSPEWEVTRDDPDADWVVACRSGTEACPADP